MSSTLCRNVLLALLVFAFAAVVPASAAPAAAPAGASAALQAGCGTPALDLPALSAETPVCKAATPQPVAPFEPDFMVVYHGYCHCSCSRVPNCNTSADCGGGRCLGGITCC
jgi:hypothetical protein